MSAKIDLTAALDTALDDATFTVLDKTPTTSLKIGPGMHAVWVSRSGFEISPAHGEYMSTFDVWLLSAHEDEGKADDDLDATLPAVITALHSIESAVHSGERGVWAETFHAYKLTVHRYTL